MTEIYNVQIFNGPVMRCQIKYEYKRDGANMLYRFYYRIYFDWSTSYYQNTLNIKFFLNGSNVLNFDYRNYSQGWVCEGTTGWYTVSNKTSGTTPFYFTIKDILNSSWVNYTSSTTGLAVSPAYTSITTFNASKLSGFDGLSSLKINWATEHIIDYLYYSIDNGSNWVGKDITDGTNGSFIINGLSYNTSYNLKIRVRRKDSQLQTDSSMINQSTYDINRIVEPLSNFSIKNGNTLNVRSNSTSGSTSKIFLETIINNTITRRFTIDGSSKSFSIEEINSLLKYFTDVQSFKIRVGVATCNSKNVEAYHSYVDGTYSIVDSKPTFDGFSYLDNNNDVSLITGSNQYIVKNKSYLRVVIPVSNKMETKNYATPAKYEVVCANRSSSGIYSENNDVNIDLNTIGLSGRQNIVVRAVDSRGFYCEKTLELDVIDYVNVIQNNTLYRVNNFEADTKLKISGSFSQVICNNVAKNNIETIRYCYKDLTILDSEYSDYVNVTPIIINDNKFNTELMTLNFDIQKSYLINIEVIDKFGIPNYVEMTIDDGKPIMYVNSDKKNVGIGLVNKHEEYSLEVAENIYANKDIYSSGKIYLASGNDVLDYEIVDSW